MAAARNRGALTAGDAVEIDRPPQLQTLDRGARQVRRGDEAVRHDGHAEIGFNERDRVALRGDFVAARNVDLTVAHEIAKLAGLFAERAHQQALVAQIVESDTRTGGEGMFTVDDQPEAFGEQRPAVEAVPGLADRRRNGELGVAALEEFRDLACGPAQELQLEQAEMPAQLGHVREQQVEIDALRQRQPQRADLAGLERGCERARAQRAVVALPQQRQHALAKFGELRVRPLAAEEVAAQLAFELADGAGERGLRHVALLGGAREVERARHGQEVANLVHLHGAPPP